MEQMSNPITMELPAFESFNTNLSTTLPDPLDQILANATFELDESRTKFTFRKFVDESLHTALLDMTDDEQFYNDTVEVSTSALLSLLPQITARVEAGNFSLMQLAFALAEIDKTRIKQYELMKDDGRITFDHLSRLFQIGTEFVAVGKEAQLVGSIVHNVRTQIGGFGEKYFVVTGLFTFSDGQTFMQKQEDFVIEEFKGLRYADTLNIRKMTPQDKEYLTERGRKFLKYGLGVHYCSYSGTMFYRTPYGNVHFNAEGRVIVDKVGYQSVNPNDRDMMSMSYGSHNGSGFGKNGPKTFTNIPDELLYLTWPFFRGFSIQAKRWGEMFVEKLGEIDFDDNAFDYLVLDPQRKKIAKSLVMDSQEGFTDIITGKSGGTIFMLHGPPGTGKTLTCEAISELLHQPLYSITVGELGTTPEVLEQKLTRILEMTKSWNAVILIDEADIFLEKRSKDDMQRNAMVGIFLRLLERHTGVMFLTTNRAEEIDEAFRSRISVIFKYPKHNAESRALIWRNLLDASGCEINESEIEELSQHDINGRQIKSAIRMAQSLARTDKTVISKQYLEDVIGLMTLEVLQEDRINQNEAT